MTEAGIGNRPAAFSQTLCDRAADWWPLLTVFAGLVIAGAIRASLLSVPLERDEGEYAYAAQLWLDGTLPYVGAYNMKMPGIYACYAAMFAIGGESIEAIHAGLLVVNLATAFILFLLAQKLTSPYVATIATIMFLIISLDRSVQGLFANAEHFVLLPSLLGITLLIPSDTARPLRWPRIALAGFLLGTAWLIKQQGVVFLLCGGGFLLMNLLHQRPIAWRVVVGQGLLFAFIAALPFGLVCWYFWQAGAWEPFRFWTITYASRYASAVSWSVAGTNLQAHARLVGHSAYGGWILGLIGWMLILAQRQIARRGELLWFGACSALAVCPGLYFRAHYFLFLMPALSLGIAWSIWVTAERYRESPGAVWLAAKIGIPVLMGAFLLYGQRFMLFRLDPILVTEATFGSEPFDEAIVIGEYIRLHSSPEDRVAVIGSEPEIYFYADRRSATGYMYAFALTESHDFAQAMQREMVAEIESHSPKFLIYVNGATSWQSTNEELAPDAGRILLDWYEQYRNSHYQLVGMVEVASIRNYQFTSARYAWGDEAARFEPESSNWLAIYQRVDEPTD